MRASLRSFLVKLLVSSTPAFAQSEDVQLRFRATLYADMPSPPVFGPLLSAFTDIASGTGRRMPSA